MTTRRERRAGAAGAAALHGARLPGPAAQAAARAGGRAAGGPGRGRRRAGPPRPPVRLPRARADLAERRSRASGCGCGSPGGWSTGTSSSARRAASTSGALAFLEKVVSPEPVLAPEVLTLARQVADRYAGTLADVLRLAVPPRHARVEAAAAGQTAQPAPEPPDRPAPEGWARYEHGTALLDAVHAGATVRAVWSALPGPTWPDEIARLVATALAGGRGALVVLPDHRDVDRVDAALTALLGAGRHVVAHRRARPGRALPALAAGPPRRGPRGRRHPGGDVRAGPRPRAGAGLGRRRRPARRAARALPARPGRCSPCGPAAEGAALVVGGLSRTAEGAGLVAVRLGPLGRGAARRGPPHRAGGAGRRRRRRPARRRRPRRPAADRWPGAPRSEALRVRPGAGPGAARRLPARPGLRHLPGTGPLPGLPRPARERRAATASRPAAGAAAPAADWACPSCDGRPGCGRRWSAPGAPRRSWAGPSRGSRSAPAAPAARCSRRSGPSRHWWSPRPAPSRSPRAGTPRRCCWTAGRCWPARPAGRPRRRCAGGRRPPPWSGRPRRAARSCCVAERSAPAVQALVRWDQAGFADRELAERALLRLPPEARMASLTGRRRGAGRLPGRGRPAGPGRGARPGPRRARPGAVPGARAGRRLGPDGRRAQGRGRGAQRPQGGRQRPGPGRPPRGGMTGPHPRAPGADARHPAPSCSTSAGSSIDWDPRYLYRQLLPQDEVSRSWTRSASHEWNHEQDAGGTLGRRRRAAQRPAPAPARPAGRLPGPVRRDHVGPGRRHRRAAPRAARRRRTRLLALTNWSAETFPHAEASLRLPRAVRGDRGVRGRGVAKPDPAVFRPAGRALRPRPGRRPSSSTTRPPTSRPRPRPGCRTLLFTGADQLRARPQPARPARRRRIEADAVAHGQHHHLDPVVRDDLVVERLARPRCSGRRASGSSQPAAPQHVVDQDHAVGGQLGQDRLVVGRGSSACRRR